jgi:single-strand DNA-binding protein
VYIEGHLKTRYWEDRDQNKKAITEIIADNLILLDKRSDANPDNPKENPERQDNATSNLAENDI